MLTADSRIAARMAMMAMTMSNSTRVKDLPLPLGSPTFIAVFIPTAQQKVNLWKREPFTGDGPLRLRLATAERKGKKRKYQGLINAGMQRGVKIPKNSPRWSRARSQMGSSN
jgi:hypothetical protein